MFEVPLLCGRCGIPVLHDPLAEFPEGVGLVDAEQGVVTVAHVHAAQTLVHPLYKGHLIGGSGEGGPSKHGGIVIHIVVDSLPTANEEETQQGTGE